VQPIVSEGVNHAHDQDDSSEHKDKVKGVVDTDQSYKVRLPSFLILVEHDVEDLLQAEEHE